MDNENYINIQGWMRTTLGLTGPRLMAYAIVYGFSQDGESSFTGGLKYIMDWCGCCKDTARAILRELTEEGLIEREDVGKNGQIVQTYRATMPPRKIQGVENSDTHPSKISTGTPRKIQPINTSNNINININNNIAQFSFLKALKAIGVSDDVARAWMQVRKTKRATNTEIAFNRIKAEIAKSGYTADECIRTAVEKSWQGFQASWMPTKRETVWSGNMDDYLRSLGHKI